MGEDCFQKIGKKYILVAMIKGGESEQCAIS